MRVILYLLENTARTRVSIYGGIKLVLSGFSEERWNTLLRETVLIVGWPPNRIKPRCSVFLTHWCYCLLSISIALLRDLILHPPPLPSSVSTRQVLERTVSVKTRVPPCFVASEVSKNFLLSLRCLFRGFRRACLPRYRTDNCGYC